MNGNHDGLDDKAAELETRVADVNGRLTALQAEAAAGQDVAEAMLAIHAELTALVQDLRDTAAAQARLLRSLGVPPVRRVVADDSKR